MKTKSRKPVGTIELQKRVLRKENKRLREELNEQTAWADEYHASAEELHRELEVIKQKENPWRAPGTKWPICPHCGFMWRDAQLHHAPASGLAKCPRKSCGKSYQLLRFHTTTFTTTFTTAKK